MPSSLTGAFLLRNSHLNWRFFIWNTQNSKRKQPVQSLHKAPEICQKTVCTEGISEVLGVNRYEQLDSPVSHSLD